MTFVDQMLIESLRETIESLRKQIAEISDVRLRAAELAGENMFLKQQLAHAESNNAKQAEMLERVIKELAECKQERDEFVDALERVTAKATKQRDDALRASMVDLAMRDSAVKQRDELVQALKACLQCFAEMKGRKPAFVEDSIAMSEEALAKLGADKTEEV